MQNQNCHIARSVSLPIVRPRGRVVDVQFRPKNRNDRDEKMRLAIRCNEYLFESHGLMPIRITAVSKIPRRLLRLLWNECCEDIVKALDDHRSFDYVTQTDQIEP